MRGFYTRRALGLVLALFLAAGPGFCWDCCCSSQDGMAREKSGHGCCPESTGDAETQKISPSANCGCPELNNETFETPRLLSSVSSLESKDSKSRSAAVVADSALALQRLTPSGSPTESPPRLSVFSLCSVSPRAPPVHA